jgi:hypothetical protein
MTVPQLAINDEVTVTVRAKVFAQPRLGDPRYALTYETAAGCGENFLHVDIASPAVTVRWDEPGADIAEETLAQAVRNVCDNQDYHSYEKVNVIRSIVDTFAGVNR